MVSILKRREDLKRTMKELLIYIIPGIMGLLFNSFYIVVDGLIVARVLGRDPLAAVTVAVPVMEIMIALSMLVSVGSGVIISNLNGQKKMKEGREVFNVAIRLLLLISVIIMIVPLIFINQITLLLGATDDIFKLTIDYLKYLFIFAPSFMLSYGLGTWLRNDGNPRLAMIAQIVGAVVNIALDILFMKYLHFGIAGASIATGIGPIVGIIIMIPHFTGKKGFLYIQKTKINIKSSIDILKKGLPSFSMEFALGLTTLCVNIIIAKYMGALGLAVYGIVGYIALMIYSVFLGMAEGSQPLLSFYHGANNKDKKDEILLLSIIIAVIVGVISYVFLRFWGIYIIKIFARSDKSLITKTNYAVKLYFILLPITGLNIILSSYMQSIENWQKSVFISLMRSLIVLYPVLLILPRFFGENGIWLAVPAAEFITLIISLLASKCK